MIIVRRSAAFAAIALLTVAAPAFARPVDVQPTDRAASVCQRNLGGTQCGRYQQQLIRATALRAGDRTDAATLREIGRRQLDQLIDSVS